MVENPFENFEKKSIHYFDIMIACLHFFNIIFTLSIVIYENIILTIVGYVFATVFLLKIFFTFKNDNPFYIYSCYGFFLCGFLFLASSFIVIPLMGLILIPELFYFFFILQTKNQFSGLSHYVTSKGRYSPYSTYTPYFSKTSSHARRRTPRAYPLSNAKEEINSEERLRQEQQRERIREKFKVKKLIRYTLILTLILLIIDIWIGQIIYSICGIDYTL